MLSVNGIMFVFFLVGENCRLQARVAGHCLTITEITQTFTKMLALGLNIIF